MPRVEIGGARIKRAHNGNIIPQVVAFGKVFAKNFRSTKLFFKNPLTKLPFFAIIPFVLNIGVSPSGKASDSDSDISGVRIPAPQPTKKARQTAGFFRWLGCSCVEARSASEATQN